MIAITKSGTSRLAILSIVVLTLTACQDAKNERVVAQLSPQKQQVLDGEMLVRQRCAGCHKEAEGGGLSRINQERKTPEGWFMTVVRMEREGRVTLNVDERRAVVKFLADSQGLAPEETAEFRYVLEKRPNIVEDPVDPELATMCGRCHSNARYSLQYRNAGDWRKLVDFHVAQFPTLEYQTMSAERPWLNDARTDFANRLGERFPLQTSAWEDWTARPANDPSGHWRVVGEEPGKGHYSGTAEISRGDGDEYQADYELSYGDGEIWKGHSEALLYTGYEWRGRSERDGKVLREVYQLSADGSSIRGRWFDIQRDERGGSWTAVRMDAGSAVLRVEPAYLKAGQSGQVRLLGVGLKGEVSLGQSVAASIVSRSDTEIILEATASADADLGPRVVQVGALSVPSQFTVYDRIDSIKVFPDSAIARIGDGGGKLPPMSAQFEAVGYTRGADGEPGTEDDIRIGVFPAQWSHDNYDEWAAEMEDARFAGAIDSSGRFNPADAQINPERYIPTNNLGVLAIIGTVVDGGEPVSGKARLVVTVQQFINPPIN